MGMQDHLTCLLRNLYAGQEVTELDMKQQTGSKFGLGVCQDCILTPCLFNLYAVYIMWNGRLDESQAGIKIARRDINSLMYVGDTTLMAENEEELKSLLLSVKEEREKNWLKAQHSKNKDWGNKSHHFMANRRGKCGNSGRLYFLGL